MRTQSDMKNSDDTLDDLLRAARDTAPAPSPDFMARVLGDALAQQPAPRGVPVSPPVRLGLWTRIAAALGGAAAVAGIGSAALAGLVIGYVQPESMVSLAGTMGITAGESLELLPGFDTLLTEELTQ